MTPNQTFFMGMDQDALARLVKLFTVAGPKQGTRELGRVYLALGTRIKSMEKSRGFSGSGGSSVGVGPGKNHGHLRDQLQRRAGARGFGGFARINFTREGAFKARWHEFGTADRYVKSYHRGRYRSNSALKAGWQVANDKSVLYRGNGSTVREKGRLAPGQGYRGKLPARAPVATSWSGVDKNWITAELGKAVIRSLGIKV